MNEITRIHIAKTPYDIEVAAKKELEKYIKNLETYTQDADVVADIEIRITEILADRGIKADGVISSEDVAAVRVQLGEPYEFSDGEHDMAVGPSTPVSGRRLYRSSDDAVLGGVLSGIAAYFNVSPFWTRLAFIVLLFISFGFVSFVYILFWIITPVARTATEKLQLAGKNVTIESIKQLSLEEEAQPPVQPPVLQRLLGVLFGAGSAIAAAVMVIVVITLIVAAFTNNGVFLDVTNGFTGLGEGNAWIAWLLFWVVIAGCLLLAALFGLIAYALLTRKVTKRMIVSGIVIIALGMASVTAVVGISANQSVRVATESRSMIRETNANLPKNFNEVTSVTFSTKTTTEGDEPMYFSPNTTIRYVVDDGPARYELSALPTAKPAVAINGSEATISLTVPESYRNSFVQPLLTVYGPALETVVSEAMNLEYVGMMHETLTVTSQKSASTTISGTYNTLVAKGEGNVDLSSSSIQSLTVTANFGLTVSAGTVRELNVTQPDVCPSGVYNHDTRVTAAHVTSGSMLYNGQQLPVKTHTTSCAVVTIESDENVQQN